jgi:hypothetical protein
MTTRQILINVPESVLQAENTDADTLALPLPSASVISYDGPEQTRSYQRKSQTPQLKSSVGDLLYQLRTGAM